MSRQFPAVRALCLALALGVPGLAPQPARAQVTFAVNSTLDGADANPGNGVCETSPGNGMCTLRAAIQETNALPSADAIILPAGTYTLSIAGVDEDASATGDLDILGDLTITGAGAATTIIDAGGLDRVFQVGFPSAITVTISGVTVRNGDTAASAIKDGGGIMVFNDGSSLTLNGVAVTGNKGSNGGGIKVFGLTAQTHINDSTVGANTASSNGGGIDSNGTLQMARSSVTGNTAAIHGGGLFSNGAATISDSLFSGNTATAGSGGGILQQSSADLVNTTISGNSGDGIYNTAANGVQTHLTNVTITGNSGFAVTNSGMHAMVNTILSGNSAGECNPFGGTFVSEGHNLFGDASCGFAIASDLVSTNPLLGPLADNGGPTRTHALLAASPAIDAGDNAACPAKDARGQARPVDGDSNATAVCDIGAYELVPPDISVSATSLDFGTVLIGSVFGSPVDRALTIANSGSGPLIIGNAAQANPLAAPFSLLGDTCSGATLQPSQSCLITVRFVPAAAGPFTDSFDIPSNDPDENPVTIALSGTGLTEVDQASPTRCFIATAAYGSESAADVALLRRFRDEYLLPYPLGRDFMDLYYRLSPPLADAIRGREPLKAVVRAALAPFVYGVRRLLGPD